MDSIICRFVILLVCWNCFCLIPYSIRVFLSNIMWMINLVNDHQIILGIALIILGVSWLNFLHNMFQKLFDRQTISAGVLLHVFSRIYPQFLYILGCSTLMTCMLQYTLKTKNSREIRSGLQLGRPSNDTSRFLEVYATQKLYFNVQCRAVNRSCIVLEPPLFPHTFVCFTGYQKIRFRYNSLKTRKLNWWSLCEFIINLIFYFRENQLLLILGNSHKLSSRR